MQTLAQIAIYIINTLGTLYVSFVLLRFLCQWVRADYYNPLSKALVKITNPLLIPLRKIIPGLFGFDFAAIFLAIVLQMIIMWLTIILLGHYTFSNFFLLIPWALVCLMGILLNFYFIGVIIIFIASWVAPYSSNPALSLLRQLIDPLMAPFRKLVPPMGGLDISSMIFFMVLQIVRHFIFPVIVNLFQVPGELLFVI